MGYYVYVHKLPNGTPFYIGKGKGKRITSRSGRSLWWKDTVKKYYGDEFPKHTILTDNLTELESLNEEAKLIKKYGRRDVQTGILVNMTDGGDGTSGYQHSKKTKRKMRSVRLGIKFSNQHRNNLSKATKRWSQSNKTESMDKVSKMVLARRKFKIAVLKNISSNTIETVIEVSKFAKKYGLHQGHISDVINGNRHSHKQWILLERKL